MRRSLITLATLALFSCRDGDATTAASTTTLAAPTSSGDVRPSRHAESSPDAASGATDASSAVGPSRDALASARARASTLEVTPSAEAAWFPQKLLAIIEQSAHALAAPSAPQFNEDVMLWSVALPAAEVTLSADARAAVCAEVHRAEPRIACETDAADIRGIERARWAFAWRTSGAMPRPNLATPLRALARIADGPCLRSFERTLNTVELGISARDVEGLGRALALLAAAPRMTELILVRTEHHGTELRAELSWPTDRVDRSSGDLEGDSWPPRCEGSARVLQDDATALRALFMIRGASARGAVLERASRQWVATVGDRVGDAEIIAIDERALRVRRTVRGRPRELEMRWEGAGREATAIRGHSTILLPTDPARGLPPGVR